MNAIDTPVNRHVVDQLADIRAQIKQLKNDEADCVDEVIAAMTVKDSLGGDQFIAMRTITNRKGSVDYKAMESAGIQVDLYRKPPTTVCTIRLQERIVEAAE